MTNSLPENTFALRPFGQKDREQDYQLLHQLSNFQVPQDPAGNAEWLENRRRYDESAGTRRHYIALHRATQEAVGYACLEEQGPNPQAFRLYMVFDPNRWAFADLGEFLYQRLLQDARELGAVSLALVEYANDRPFLDFLRAHGFAEAGTADYNGFAIARMEKSLAGNPPFHGSDLLFVVSGCSSGGKSTLLKEMAVRGYTVLPEPGRQIVQEQLSAGGDGLPWENTLKFVELCAARSLSFYSTATQAHKPAFFDRSLLDSLSAFQSMGLPASAYLKEAVSRCRYASRVFMAPPWKELFVNDLERRHSFEEAEAEYASLLETYQVNGYEVVLLPKGPLSDRAAFLERQIGE